MGWILDGRVLSKYKTMVHQAIVILGEWERQQKASFQQIHIVEEMLLIFRHKSLKLFDANLLIGHKRTRSSQIAML